MSLADRRLPPFCWQALDAIEHIHGEAIERAVAPTLALYLGLTYLASRKHRQIGDDGAFPATRAEVMEASGLSAGSVHKFSLELERLELLEKQERSIDGRSVASTWALRDRVSSHDTPLSSDDGRVSSLGESTTPTRAGETRRLKDGKKTPVPPEFETWMENHVKVTGNRAGARPGTALYRKLAAAFTERKAEHSEDDLRLISAGAMADEHRREKGYLDAESVLRPGAAAKLLERGRQAQPSQSDWAGDDLLDRTRRQYTTTPPPEE